MAAPLPDSGMTTPLVDPSMFATVTGRPPLAPLVTSRQLRSQRLGRALRLWIPVGLLILLLAMCFLLPLIYTLPSPTNGDILVASEPPFSPGHILGTDPVGVDIFSQIVYGGQEAFEVAIATTIIGLVVGSAIGITAGYFGGWVDAVLSRVLDVLIAFPALVLALVIAQGLGPSKFHLILALSAFGIPTVGRVTRGSTLVLRSQPFMTAARLAGTRGWRIIVRHIVPNITPTLVTFSLLGIGILIILEGALDYLGYGTPPPNPSWGNMIATGQTVMTAQPEYVLIPSIFLLVTVIALNMLGDALRERWGLQ
jgi:peptide/nickel transport system permease protein